MKSCVNVLLNFTRNSSRHIKSWKPDGVKYGNIIYYPRVPGQVDPPIKPSKVLLVYRVKPFKGNPYWEKDILKELGFLEKEKKPVVVKNTPEMCNKLWEVKHLIKIVSVQLPEKLPELNDSTCTYLHENGTFHVTSLNAERYKASLSFKNSIKNLHPKTIEETLRLQWNKTGSVN